MDLLNPPRLDKVSIKKSFNRAAGKYSDSAVLQEEVLSRLIQRLDYIRHIPGSVLDMGCGTGKAISGLKSRYPKCKIVGLDLANLMLVESAKQFGLFDRKRLVNADMEQLPFADNCFDLVFSCLALQWANNLAATFKDIARIGNQGGLFMFATFGPGTLVELRDSWNVIDSRPHVHQFIDMHDVGDALMAAGFTQPVVDAEIIKLEYDSFRAVLADLKNIGASNAEKNRSRGLMTPGRLRQLEDSYRERAFGNGKYIASYEVVYGHAWLD